jgi:RNA polymerase sigma-70 factor (ECF subfamily)
VVNAPKTRVVGDPSAPPEPGPAATDSADAARDEVRELVSRTLRGDDDAYAEIFRRYRDRVHRISFRFTRDGDDAMDLTQTVFIKAHRALASYREESSFATWISRVATNCGIDWIRARQREGRARLDETLDVESSASADAPGSPRLGPRAAALNAELGRAIQAAVADLSEKHRTVFVLHCVEGMPYQAIADTVGISIGTVMSRLFHARRYLRRSLAPYLGEAQVRSLLRGQEDEIPATLEGRAPARTARTREDA